jgi:hypothetical protein
LEKVLNKNKRGILYGLVLGDGNLYLPKGQVNYSLTIGHGKKQQEYLEYKASLINSLFGGKKLNINEYNSLNKTTNKEYTNIQIRHTNPYYNQIHRNLYSTGSKKITRKCLDYLTDQGLALWFMDDGSGVVTKNKQKIRSGCMIRLSTYCSKEEAEIVKNWFIKKYNLSPVFDIDNRNNKYSIRLKTQDSIKFCNIISKYIIPSMDYKIRDILNYIPRVRDIQVLDEDIV